METVIVIMLLVIGAAMGGLIVAAWFMDRRPLIDQFREMLETSDTPEVRARRNGL